MKVRRAFTLIELLVVIAIIAILAAILFPVFAQARAKARQTMCLSNTKQIGLGLMQYVQDYDETYPMSRYGGPGSGIFEGQTNTPSWPILILPYVKNVGVFACPSDTTSIVQTRAAGDWCPDQVVTIVGGQRRDLYRRSLSSVSGLNEPGTTSQQQYPGAIMVDGWDRRLAP
jgi:prepilin-type N-terminal cleavage/methylation domain-containing protein